SRRIPVSDTANGPGRVSRVPTTTFRACCDPRPRWSVAVSHHDGVHMAFDNGNGLGLHNIQSFGATFPRPTRPLSTLRTPRYRDARKTWFRPVRYDPSRTGLSPACPSSVLRRTPDSCRKANWRILGRWSHALAALRMFDWSRRIQFWRATPATSYAIFI